MPKGLIAPELHDIEFSFWRAFWDLSTDRRGGEFPGAIPWSSMREYAKEMRGIKSDDFMHIMREMDEVYLSHEPPKSEQQD